MGTIPTWIGDLPGWITTIAIALAAGQLLMERKARRAEDDREKKLQATHLSAWTVTDVEASSRLYGVVILNSSKSTFHDVRITCVMHGHETDRPIELNVVPPGRYMVELNPSGSQYTWDFAVEAESYEGWLRPYMKSTKYEVIEMRFVDNLNQEWLTNRHALLALVQP